MLRREIILRHRTIQWAFLVLASVVVLSWPAAAVEKDYAQKPAIPSDLLKTSLLLDVNQAGDRLVAVGEWGHVILSDDKGKTWHQANSVPTRMTLTEVTFIDAQNGWAVGHDAVVLHTSDGGENWALQFADAEDEALLLSVWFENKNHGIVVGQFGLMLETRDGGKNWERRPPRGSARRSPERWCRRWVPRDGCFGIPRWWRRGRRSSSGRWPGSRGRSSGR